MKLSVLASMCFPGAHKVGTQAAFERIRHKPELPGGGSSNMRVSTVYLIASC